MFEVVLARAAVLHAASAAACGSSSAFEGGASSRPEASSRGSSEDPDDAEYQDASESLRKRKIVCAVAAGLTAAGDGRAPTCLDQLAREEALLESQRTVRIEGERDRALVRNAMEADAERQRLAGDAMRRWSEELRTYGGGCLDAQDAGCLAEAVSLCDATLVRSPDAHLAETCGLLRDAHGKVLQAAANARAAEAAALRERQRAAIADSKTAPPWHCYAASLGAESFGACAVTADECKARSGRAKKAKSATVGACKTQPLAACVVYTIVLDQATNVSCFESIAACERFRADAAGAADYSDVSACDIVPTSWLPPG